jgi:hypothetical protein
MKGANLDNIQHQLWYHALSGLYNYEIKSLRLDMKKAMEIN